MSFLEENEWMFLNDIAYNISYIYSFDEMRKNTLEWLNRLMNFNGAVFSTVESGHVITSIATGIEKNGVDLFNSLYECSSSYGFLLSGRNYAWKQSEIISDKSLQNDVFFKKFCLPRHFEYAAGMNIVFREEVVGLINFYRKKEYGDFSRRELFIVDQLQKHLAYRLYYEAKKGDTRYFYAKGYHERICREFGLTGRESEILDYAVKGYSNEKMAELMSISVNTVKKHLHSLYEKMNVKNRVQLLQSLPLSTDKINFDEL